MDCFRGKKGIYAQVFCPNLEGAVRSTAFEGKSFESLSVLFGAET